MFYWIETGERWTIDTDLAAVTWEDNSIGNCILPGEVTLKEGPDPHEMVFIVKGDPLKIIGTAGPQGRTLFQPNCTDNLPDRRPDGTDGDISMPSFMGETFKPFQLVRVQSSPLNDKANPTTRFLGVILGAQLDLAQEEWRITCYDLVRWYLTKVYHTGIYYQPPIDGENPIFLPDALPVYNEDGRADQMVAADPDVEVDTVLFTNPDLNSYQGIPNPLWPANYGGYWTLGSALNQLRHIYTVDAATFSRPDLSKIMDWPEVTADNWKFLLVQGDTVLPQVIKNFALGAVSLSDCIDAIVRRAGGYTWGMTFNPTTLKHELKIYDSHVGDGRSGSMTRTAAGRLAHDSGELVGGTIGYDWSNCATKVKVFGQKERWETTIGHGTADPDGAPMEGFILTPDWTTTEQDNYQIKEKLGEDVEKYKEVFQRFRIAYNTGWDLITGHDAKCGPRQLLDELLTEDTSIDEHEQHRKLKLRIYRWESNSYSEAPDSVNVHLNKDLTVTITGFDAADDPFQDAKGKRQYPRYLCSIPALSTSPWAVHAFRLTVAVEDDTRLLGEETDVPAGWPELEDVVDGVDASIEQRLSALHGTRHNGPVATPAQNDYQHFDYMNPDTAETLHDDQDVVDVTAKRRLQAVARPLMTGELRLSYIDWDLSPGWQITTLENYADAAAPPTVQVYGVIRSTTLTGLAAEGSGQQHTVIELGTH